MEFIGITVIQGTLMNPYQYWLDPDLFGHAPSNHFLAFRSLVHTQQTFFLSILSTTNNIWINCRVVEYATRSDMKNAIAKLDNTELNGRKIRVVEDTHSSGTSSSSRKRRFVSIHIFSILSLLTFQDNNRDHLSLSKSKSSFKWVSELLYTAGSVVVSVGFFSVCCSYAILSFLGCTFSTSIISFEQLVVDWSFKLHESSNLISKFNFIFSHVNCLLCSRSRSHSRSRSRSRSSRSRSRSISKDRSRSRTKEPQKSPAGRSRSPAGRSRSPAGRSRSPAGRSRSPAGRSRSPAGRSPSNRKAHSRSASRSVSKSPDQR